MNAWAPDTQVMEGPAFLKVWCTTLSCRMTVLIALAAATVMVGLGCSDLLAVSVIIAFTELDDAAGCCHTWRVRS